MNRSDKYGRGSAAANGAGFVDLAPGDTFDGLEKQLRARIADVYENRMLGISASIGSKRNANELAKHMARGEGEEVHKFAAKNIGVLFERAQLGIRHFDKKAIRDDEPKPVMLRVFSCFKFAETPFLATITLRAESSGNKLYAVEAVDITKDAWPERTPRGGTAPLLDLTSFVEDSIAYYVGDCNRTQPEFVNRTEPFSIARAVALIKGLVVDFAERNFAVATTPSSVVDLRLRRAELRDMRAVFELSNDPTVRANSIHPEPISWETHVAWFTAAIASPDVVFLLAVTPEDALAGQIRFNRRGDQWVVTINLVLALRGRGLAKSLLRDAMSRVPAGKFVAEIADANEPSKRLFKSLGFLETPARNSPLGFHSFELPMNSKTITIENFASMSVEKRKLVWAWRNSDRIRLKMTNTEIIPLENHLKFIEGLAGRDDKMYFLFSINDEPFGVLDFVNCDHTAKTCETGLYIGNEKYLGLGFLLYYYNFQVAFEHFDFETINTSILKNNPGAFSICTRLFGLKVVGGTDREYFVRYTKDAWLKVPSTFKQKILLNAQVGEARWI